MKQSSTIFKRIITQNVPIVTGAVGTLPSVMNTSSILMMNNIQLFSTMTIRNKDSAMHCMQCEQTEQKNGVPSGCTVAGVCGKSPEVAHLQDGLVHALKGMSEVAAAARKVGIINSKLDRFLLTATFSTLTNVNFDAKYFYQAIPEAITLRNQVHEAYLAECRKQNIALVTFSSTVSWTPKSYTEDDIEKASVTVGLQERKAIVNNDEVFALQELIMYGLKGTAAYACHAMEAGKEDNSIYEQLHNLYAMLSRNEMDANKLVAAALEVGKVNVSVMALLDNAHTSRFGVPVPTPVNHAQITGKCILISGHDLVDLEHLLQQTAGKGINVYTHGEMLPAHGYPNLKNKFPHLVGHYGGPWQLQRTEYAAFPGAIIQSTNCIMEPKPSYKDRLFTTNSTGFPGVTHISADPVTGARDFTPVINKALAMEGFKTTKPAKNMLTGFGHDSVIGAAPAVLGAIEKGDLKKIVLIGGCDGNESERSYYTKLATGLPNSAAILTLGCGKYRILGKKDYGNIPNTAIPRVLDMGQCNDSYSAIKVASTLASVLQCGVNDLPLSIVLSWFEQKATAVLLSLLSLGVKNIRIGPNLPAYITPATLSVLSKNFGLMPIDAASPESDIKKIMNM